MKVGKEEVVESAQRKRVEACSCSRAAHIQEAAVLKEMGGGDQ